MMYFRRFLRRAEAIYAELNRRHQHHFHPVFDLSHLTPAERDRVIALQGKTEAHRTGDQIDWSKMSTEDLMEMQALMTRAQSPAPAPKSPKRRREIRLC